MVSNFFDRCVGTSSGPVALSGLRSCLVMPIVPITRSLMGANGGGPLLGSGQESSVNADLNLLLRRLDLLWSIYTVSVQKCKLVILWFSVLQRLLIKEYVLLGFVCLLVSITLLRYLS